MFSSSLSNSVLCCYFSLLKYFVAHFVNMWQFGLAGISAFYLANFPGSGISVACLSPLSYTMGFSSQGTRRINYFSSGVV